MFLQNSQLMKISHILGFPFAEVKTQPKPKKPEKKPPQHKNVTNPPLPTLLTPKDFPQ